MKQYKQKYRRFERCLRREVTTVVTNSVYIISGSERSCFCVLLTALLPTLAALVCFSRVSDIRLNSLLVRLRFLNNLIG